MPSSVLNNQIHHSILFPNQPLYPLAPCVFGSTCFVHNHSPGLDKLSARSHKCVFLGYPRSQKGYKCFSPSLHRYLISADVTFLESSFYFPSTSSSSAAVLTPSPPTYLPIALRKGTRSTRNPSPHYITLSYHRRSIKNICNTMTFVSQVEPKTINETLHDEHWLMAMQEELNQFARNEVRDLVPLPSDHPIIGTKWVFRNKLDESRIIIRNKARLVVKGHNQEEGIDYDETFAPITRIEAIRLLLAYASIMNFKLYQMDVKSAFLNGFIQEEVYVEQPLGFVDFKYPNHVYKLKNALYGLKQAPRSWYDRLSKFLEITIKRLWNAYIFTKPLPKERFNLLRIKLGIINESCLN
uniref:Retrovirus-related Pol polyprotein from transposon TNT 1-94 n=1 Tax=Cajanus cajan TaxID=3821 RepID=A0A151SG12_CAJCA|nr:Retrovirus-related Pol polyprotein from transposon TNT 1-94 [Cajanus cajan]